MQTRGIHLKKPRTTDVAIAVIAQLANVTDGHRVSDRVTDCPQQWTIQCNGNVRQQLLVIVLLRGKQTYNFSPLIELERHRNTCNCCDH